MTKQEQIEEMAVIGCVRNPQAHTAEECAKCDFKQGQCNAYRHAEALYDAGYRKIKEKNETLEEQIEELRNEKWDAQDDLDCYYDEMPSKIKQAKIDVLNEVNEKINTISRKFGESGITGMFKCSCAIDELIREVQNAKDKS